ncbi:hypothetical protein NQ314_010320 [Rhamnusium bicolor]|uniref:Uncharacterized protein n=1 Tax=Rhamnusium bicolor TaxID=1586634 RepID=A0AAV8XTA5_9CUCU|nr:hypothetical protein NQ314_010320 [Rhamnusium bicolor]
MMVDEMKNKSIAKMTTTSKTTGRAASVFEDLSNVEFETSEDVEVIDKFKNMNLKEELLRGIFAYGE